MLHTNLCQIHCRLPSRLQKQGSHFLQERSVRKQTSWAEQMYYLDLLIKLKELLSLTALLNAYFQNTFLLFCQIVHCIEKQAKIKERIKDYASRTILLNILNSTSLQRMTIYHFKPWGINQVLKIVFKLYIYFT